jgi:hypothetical protein
MEDYTYLLTEIWNPTNWADIVLTGYDFINFFAAVNANCDLQKLINQVTNALGENASTTAARVGGGFIYEIPNAYDGIKVSENCFDKSVNAAKIFSIVFNFYI